jgi:hypothetical protein
MVESTASLVKHTIVRTALSLLEYDEFQRFCDRFLSDLGYQTQLGPLRGPDGGQDIIGYTPSGGRFIAHCTTIKSRSKLRGKFVADAIAGSRANKESKLSPPNELIFFSVEPAFSGLDQQTNFVIETILPELQTIDPVYSVDHLHTLFYSAEQIEVSLHGSSFPDAKLILQDKLCFIHNQLLSAESILESEDFWVYDRASTSIIRHLLNEYGSAQSELERSKLLPQLLERLWGALWAREVDWAPLTGASTDEQSKKLIIALGALRSARFEHARVDSAFEFVQSARRFRTFDKDSLNRSLDIFLSRLIKAIYYRFPSIADQESIRALIIEEMRASPTPMMTAFAVDLVLRHESHYILLSPDVYDAARHIADAFAAEMPESVLSRVRGYLTDPIASLPKRRVEFVQIFIDLAKACRHGIEVRWCITGFMRFFPLFASDDAGESGDDDIDLVVESFDGTVVKDAPTLIFFKLRRILRRAAWSRFSSDVAGTAIASIAEYEKLFLKFREKLHRSQRAHLILEYVGSLYVVVQILSPAERNELQLVKLCNSHQTLLSSALFYHRSASSESILATNPDSKSEDALLVWLSTLAKAIYAAEFDSDISANHLASLQFPLSANIPPIYGAIAQVVSDGLQRIATDESLPASYFCRSCRTMRFVSRGAHADIVLSIIQKAMAATGVDALVAAPAIAEALYFCASYGTPPVRERATRIAQDFSRQHLVGEVSEVPQRFWSYIACIFYSQRPVEQQFLQTLAKAFDAVGISPNAEMTIPASHIQRIASEFAGLGGLFAKALLNDPIDGEIWNMIGTTVMVHRANPEDAMSAHIASIYYRMAIIYARAGRGSIVKSTYNFIFSHGMELWLNDEIATAEYIKSALDFLDSPHAEAFLYKDERTKYLFDVIKRDLSSASKELTIRLKSVARRRKWVRRAMSSAGASAPRSASVTGLT